LAWETVAPRADSVPDRADRKRRQGPKVGLRAGGRGARAQPTKGRRGARRDVSRQLQRAGPRAEEARRKVRRPTFHLPSPRDRLATALDLIDDGVRIGLHPAEPLLRI